MNAVMIKEEYIDLKVGVPYEVDRVYSGADGHIKLKNSPRKYDSSVFNFYVGDERISFNEAYRRQRFKNVKRKIGSKS